MNKYILVIALIFCGAYLSFLSGEEKAPKTGGPFEIELKEPASKYWMYVPNEYTQYRSWPLMILLHGAGGNAKDLIPLFTDEAQSNGYIVAALKSPGQTWTDMDEKLIFKAIEDIRKKYSIDSGRIFLAGFSAGSFMTCLIGFKNHSMFRGIAPIAGAIAGKLQGQEFVKDKDIKEASKHLAVLIVCGDQDPGYAMSQQAYKTLQKEKVDVEFHIMPGVGHTFDQTAVSWIYEKFQDRLNKPDELLKRGKKASSDKRYLDAIDAFNKIVETCKDNKKEEKSVKEAQQELKKIGKISSDKYSQALKMIDAKKIDEGIKLLNEIITQFEGTSVWEKAMSKLNEIELPGNRLQEK